MKKTAIVTGCAKGIGKQIAIDLSKKGYKVIGTYNTSLNEIINLSNQIKENKNEFEYYKLDLSDLNNINSFSNKIKKSYTNIDVLINNAALSLDSSFLEKTKEEFMKVLEVNLVGPFLLIQQLNSVLLNSKIINISSTDGINTYSTMNMDYSSSKAGLINLTKSLSLELTNSKVYAICPNWVNTESIREMNEDYLNNELERIGQKRLIEPSDVSNKVLEILDSDLKTGSIIVMEDCDDKK